MESSTQSVILVFEVHLKMAKFNGSFLFATKMKFFTNRYISFVRNLKLALKVYKMLNAFSVLAISAFFLLATIFVFLIEKEIKETVHGKIVVFFVTSLLLTYLQFPNTLHQWIGSYKFQLQFSLLASVFASILWTSVMSFDSWWSIR